MYYWQQRPAALVDNEGDLRVDAVLVDLAVFDDGLDALGVDALDAVDGFAGFFDGVFEGVLDGFALGDDFNDFAFLGKVPHQARFKKGSQYQAWWGTKWIQLPNPLYGSWERAVYDFDSTMTETEKRRRQYGAINSKEAVGIPPDLPPRP